MRFTLEQGRRYIAHVKLSGLEAMFGDADDVRAEFVKLGVSELDVRDLDGGRFDVTGRWAKPTETVELPSQVTGVEPLDRDPSSATAEPGAGAPGGASPPSPTLGDETAPGGLSGPSTPPSPLEPDPGAPPNLALPAVRGMFGSVMVLATGALAYTAARRLAS